MKKREVVVYSLVFMFVFSITGNMSSAHLNKSKMSNFVLDKTNRNQYYTVELSAKNYVAEDDQYINAVVLFNKDVIVDIKDLEITRKYDSLNGLAGRFPIGLFNYLKTAWFVSAIEEDKHMQLSAEDEIIINDNFTDYVVPTKADQLSWGVDWIDAEKVWGGEEDATDVVNGNYAGQNIKVGIIDTGIDYTHPDLDDNYIGGIDYVNNDADPFDDEGHGTHVAGIVGAEDNDIVSIIGVAPNVSLYGIKVLNDEGEGSYSNIIAGIDWAVNNNLDIINLSFGGSSGTSALEESINRAWDAGIVVVAAAGNYDGRDLLVRYPARYEKSIAVANLEPVPSPDNPTSVTRNSVSCMGDSLDVSAPGTFIISTYPSNSYYEANGTSMAAPMVAGTCALILSVNPLFSPYDVKNILVSIVGDLGDTGHDNQYGYGQINAWDAVEKADITDPSDTDSDGLYDREEMQLGTDRLTPDTDGDGLLDGEEVNTYFTDPRISDANRDSDYDSITNVDEIDVYGTNPFSSDTDCDVMLDPWEIENGLNPLLDDTGEDPDGDGLLNIAEFHNNCDPQDSDTDKDGLTDGEEVLTYHTNPWIADMDGDYMPDGWEIDNGFNPTNANDGTADADGDGLRNFEEYLIGTEPNDSDTDNDGLNDLWEILWGTNPFVADSTADPDNDGLTNEEEQFYETDPTNSDSDGDGLDDGMEVDLGYDPTDPNSNPGGGGGFFFP